MRAKKKTSRKTPLAWTQPAADPRQLLDKLHAAQKAFEEAEREYGESFDWLSPRQKYRTLDAIDETMEELVYDMRNAPGLSIISPLPDLTASANLLLTELRGRLMRRLNLKNADIEMRHQRGLDR